ncbi:unnamed protein product [Closterium sp. NIES-65]|nr:unnamed protein product [Closterium sp. NIES-65]
MGSKSATKAKAGSSKGTANAAPQGQKGSGVCVDKDTVLAVVEMKFGRMNRYICRLIDKTEAGYCNVVAVSVFEGYVSDVILVEFAGAKEDVIKQYRSESDVAQLMPAGIWTVMWSRAANAFRDRFQEVAKEYNTISKDRAALSEALFPALWFYNPSESIEAEKAAKTKMATDMITCAALCAAFAPRAAKVTGVKPERLSGIFAGTACAMWCFSETNATAEAAGGEKGGGNHYARSVL